MNYIEALNNPASPYHREACNLASRLLDSSESTVIGGVLRWRSNGRVPPLDVVALAASLDDKVSNAASTAARISEEREFIAAYAASQPPQMSAENLSEARAAHGPGARLVDVFTGRITRT